MDAEDVLATTISHMIVKQEEEHITLIAATGEHNVIVYHLLEKEPTFDFDDDNSEATVPFPYETEKHKLLVGFNDEITDCVSLGDGIHFAASTNSANVRLFSKDDFGAVEVVGHRDIVLTMDVSADGRYLATGAKDNTVRIWKVGFGSDNLPSATLLLECKGHAESVGAVKFSPLNCTNAPSPFFLVSASRDRTLKLWDIRALLKSDEHVAEMSESGSLTADCLSTIIAHEKDVNSIDISPDGRLVASGSQDRTLKIWNTTDLSLAGTLKGHRRGVWRVRFSPVDKIVASCSGDKTVKLWSLQDFTCLRTLEGHMDSVLNFAFINNGMQIMSSGSDGVLKLWVIKTQECVGTFSEDHSDKVWAMCVMPDEKTVVTGGVESQLNVWNDVTEQEVLEEKQEKEDKARKQQDLDNVLYAENYALAIKLALELDHPRKLLSVFSKVAHLHDGDDEGAVSASNPTLNAALSVLSEDHLRTLMGHIRDWNTNSRNAVVAQRVLASVLETVHPTALQSVLKTMQNREDVLDSLLTYSNRHFDRFNRMMQKSYLLDYTLDRIAIASSSASVLKPSEYVAVKTTLPFSVYGFSEEGQRK